jgi:hypothetical protein
MKDKNLYKKGKGNIKRERESSSYGAINFSFVAGNIGKMRENK